MADNSVPPGSVDELASLLQRARTTASGPAVAELLCFFRPYLKQLARQKLARGVRPKEGSSDVAQATIVEGYGSFQTCEADNPAAFRKWVRRILVNNLHDLHRRYLGTKKRNALREQSIHESDSQGKFQEQIVATTDSPSRQMCRDEQIRLIQRAVALLSPDERQAIALRFEETLTFAEIGKLTGLSPGAAEQYVKRAVFKLGQILKTIAKDDALRPA